MTMLLSKIQIKMGILTHASLDNEEGVSKQGEEAALKKDYSCLSYVLELVQVSEHYTQSETLP